MGKKEKKGEVKQEKREAKREGIDKEKGEREGRGDKVYKRVDTGRKA